MTGRLRICLPNNHSWGGQDPVLLGKNARAARAGAQGYFSLLGDRSAQSRQSFVLVEFDFHRQARGELLKECLIARGVWRAFLPTGRGLTDGDFFTAKVEQK